MSRAFLAAIVASASFCLSARADLVMVRLGVSEVFEQTGDIAPVPVDTLDVSTPYIAEAGLVERGSASLFSAASVTYPGEASARPMASNSQYGWSYADYREEVSSLPTGTYTISMTETGGTLRQVQFNVDAIGFPSAPVFADYASLQDVDAATDLTVSWGAWAEGTADDFIMIVVYNDYFNEVYSSPLPSESGAMRGTATQWTIPAGTFAPGMPYYISLRFIDAALFETGLVDGYADAYKALYTESRTYVRAWMAGTAPMSHLASFSLRSVITVAVDQPTGTYDCLPALPGNFFEQVLLHVPEDECAPKTEVFLDGPAGSGYADVACTDSSNDEGSSYYAFRNIAPYLPDGEYSVDLGTERGTITGSVDYAPSQADAIFPVLTFEVEDSLLKSMSWAPYNIDGTPASFGSGKVNFWIHCNMKDGSFPIFGYHDSAANTTVQAAVTIPVTEIRSMSVSYSYYWNDAGSANSNILGVTLAPSDQLDIFAGLYRYDSGWIPPEGNDADAGFGWLNDSLYPYVYSARLDMMANGGTYMGDGSGWIYIYAGGSLTDGFCFYRYHTGSWCWTRGDQDGVCYDYTSGLFDLTP